MDKPCQDNQLTEFSIVLVANHIDPSIINPDFLRHNEIIDQGRQTSEQPLSTPVYSRKDVLPEVHLKTVYQYQERRIIMEIGRTERQADDGSKSRGFLFQANIHRDVAESSAAANVEKLLSILSEWKSDLADFHELVSKFCHKIGDF